MQNKIFPLYYKMYQLLKILYRTVKNFPKEHKYCLGADMLSLGWECLDLAVLANNLPNDQKKDKISDKLKLLRDEIDDFLKQKLSLNLNNNKTKIQQVERGIDFLGYFLKPDIIHVRRKVVKRYKNKLYRVVIGLEKTDLRSLLSMASSYAGHFRHAS